MEYITHSKEETVALGRRLGAKLKNHDIIFYTGGLGMGKTAFTRGLARGLGCRGRVTSPTFTIVQIYDEGRLPFYHFDVYRIADVEEMYELDCEGYFYGDGVCLIEWASQIRDILPDDCHQVTIAKDLKKGFDFREITLDEMR